MRLRRSTGTKRDLKVLLAPQETEMCYWHHISFGSDTGTRNENIATGTIFRCIKKYNYSLVYEGQLNCEAGTGRIESIIILITSSKISFFLYKLFIKLFLKFFYHN